MHALTIKKDEGRFGHELHPDRRTLPLTAGYTLDEGPSDHGVGAMLQPELLDHPPGQPVQVAIGRRPGQPELGREADGLPRRRGDLEAVVLRHEGDLLPNRELGGIDLVVVEPDVGGDGQPSPAPGPAGQYVQEARLAGTGRAHDGRNFLLRYLPPYVGQELLGRVLLRVPSRLQRHVDVAPGERLALPLGEGVVGPIDGGAVRHHAPLAHGLTAKAGFEISGCTSTVRGGAPPR